MARLGSGRWTRSRPDRDRTQERGAGSAPGLRDGRATDAIETWKRALEPRAAHDGERVALDGRVAVPAVEPGEHVHAGDDFGDHREADDRSEEHTSELQSQFHLVCRLL